MQAIIPVAGAGTRLRPLTYTQPKALIAVAGKPILSFIIDELLENGVNDFIFVIGYLGEKIREFVEKEYPQLNARFVTQEERIGSAHAIWCAKEEINPNEPLVIHLGDSIVDIDIKKILAEEHSIFCVKKVEDPRAFGVAEINSEGVITGVIEKPQIPRSNMALVGFYFVKETALLLEAVNEQIEKGEKLQNELYLTESLMSMIRKGVTVKAYKVDSWYDVGKKDILLETNAILLRKQGEKATNKGTCENAIIVPPVSISKGAIIRNSIIGPNVSVGENSEINYSIIKNSIIGSFSKLENVVLHGSLIGSDSCVAGLSQSLNIGDNTEIDLRGEKQ
ncbi:MAG: NTP transferase domain-containing protein [Chitinophagales bacterium]|nr:NTP transferase domain-containing protein [Chitinophagales bacterium]